MAPLSRGWKVREIKLSLYTLPQRLGFHDSPSLCDQLWWPGYSGTLRLRDQWLEFEGSEAGAQQQLSFDWRTEQFTDRFSTLLDRMLKQNAVLVTSMTNDGYLYLWRKSWEHWPETKPASGGTTSNQLFEERGNRCPEKDERERTLKQTVRDFGHLQAIDVPSIAPEEHRSVVVGAARADVEAVWIRPMCLRRTGEADHLAIQQETRFAITCPTGPKVTALYRNVSKSTIRYQYALDRGMQMARDAAKAVLADACARR
jgi:hypothetical protein